MISFEFIADLFRNGAEDIKEEINYWATLQ